VTLTSRGKWLTAIAAGIAAWVFFGPKNPDAVEASAETAKPAAHSSHAATVSHAPVQLEGVVLGLAHRVVDQTAAASLFPQLSWYVAPPPPPPAPVVTAPVAPAKPEAPPLPYKLIGSYTPDGEKTVFFLSAGEKVFDVHVGETLDNTYSIDSYNNGQLVLTYKPLNQQQQLQLTGTAK
jgi:hypothetical protein